MRLMYVNADHTHPLWRQEGTLLVRSLGSQGKGKRGPRNQLVKLDSGVHLVAPYGNWKKVDG